MGDDLRIVCDPRSSEVRTVGSQLPKMAHLPKLKDGLVWDWAGEHLGWWQRTP